MSRHRESDPRAVVAYVVFTAFLLLGAVLLAAVWMTGARA